ncbi:MAG: sialidase family protein, partial [Phycisphaerae bacterium]
MYDNKRISGSLIAAIAVFGSCCLAAPLYGASGQEPGEVSEVSAQQRADVMRFEALPRQRKPELAAAADTAIVLAAREGSLLAIDVQSSDEYRLGPVQEKARIENPRLVSHGDQVLALWQERYRVESDHKERIDSWMTVSRDDGETFGQPLRLGEEGWFVAAGEPAVTDSGEVWALTEEWMLEDRVPALRLYRINSDDELRSMAVAQGESGDRWKDARLATDGDEAWVAWLRVGTFGTSADLRHSVHPGAQWSSLPSLAMDGDPVGLRLVRSGD